MLQTTAAEPMTTTSATDASTSLVLVFRFLKKYHYISDNKVDCFLVSLGYNVNSI